MTPNLPVSLTIAVYLGLLASILFTVLAFRKGAFELSKNQIERTAIPTAVGAVMLLWFAVAIIVGSSGFFARSDFLNGNLPNISFIGIPLIAGLLLFAFSSRLRRVIAAIPGHWLIGIQIYRAVGAIFVILYMNHMMPSEFGLPAGVGDLIVGLAAPIVAYSLFFGKRYARRWSFAWNIFGIADLVVAVTMGLLTSPGPFHFLAQDTPNELITAYPLVLVPAFAVPLSILLHVFSFYQLSTTKNTVFGGEPCRRRQ